jgi:hypothetical protein
MLVQTKRTKPPTFQPFAMTINVETEQEFLDLSALFSYYQTIPREACAIYDERYKRMEDICMKIHDALDNEDQY